MGHFVPRDGPTMLAAAQSLAYHVMSLEKKGRTA